MIKLILNLLFPPRCAICRRVGENALCRTCASKIVMIDRREGYVYCAGAYSGILEKAIKLLKFRGKKSLAQPLGRILADHNPYISADALVPVPLHEKRLKERGFNQSSLICRAVAEKMGIPVIDDVLVRKKDTEHMFGLGRRDRRQNLEGAFEVARPHVIRGASLILADDIYTTGFTVAACRKALLDAGAASVKALVLSRAGLL